eukprot:ANDGO_04206.mRNA.1 hypothetical protein
MYGMMTMLVSFAAISAMTPAFVSSSSVPATLICILLAYSTYVQSLRSSRLHACMDTGDGRSGISSSGGGNKMGVRNAAYANGRNRYVFHSGCSDNNDDGDDGEIVFANDGRSSVHAGLAPVSSSVPPPEAPEALDSSLVADAEKITEIVEEKTRILMFRLVLIVTFCVVGLPLRDFVHSFLLLLCVFLPCEVAQSPYGFQREGAATGVASSVLSSTLIMNVAPIVAYPITLRFLVSSPHSPLRLAGISLTYAQVATFLSVLYLIASGPSVSDGKRLVLQRMGVWRSMIKSGMERIIEQPTPRSSSKSASRVGSTPSAIPPHATLSAFSSPILSGPFGGGFGTATATATGTGSASASPISGRVISESASGASPSWDTFVSPSFSSSPGLQITVPMSGARRRVSDSHAVSPSIAGMLSATAPPSPSGSAAISVSSSVSPSTFAKTPSPLIQSYWFLLERVASLHPESRFIQTLLFLFTPILFSLFSASASFSSVLLIACILIGVCFAVESLLRFHARFLASTPMLFVAIVVFGALSVEFGVIPFFYGAFAVSTHLAVRKSFRFFLLVIATFSSCRLFPQPSIIAFSVASAVFFADALDLVSVFSSVSSPLYPFSLAKTGGQGGGVQSGLEKYRSMMRQRMAVPMIVSVLLLSRLSLVVWIVVLCAAMCFMNVYARPVSIAGAFFCLYISMSESDRIVDLLAAAAFLYFTKPPKQWFPKLDLNLWAFPVRLSRRWTPCILMYSILLFLNFIPESRKPSFNSMDAHLMKNRPFRSSLSLLSSLSLASRLPPSTWTAVSFAIFAFFLALFLLFVARIYGHFLRNQHFHLLKWYRISASLLLSLVGLLAGIPFLGFWMAFLVWLL